MKRKETKRKATKRKVTKRKGKTSAAGHFGKAVKGQFIRFLAQNQITKTKDFIKFEYDNFKWDGKHFVKSI